MRNRLLVLSLALTGCSGGLEPFPADSGGIGLVADSGEREAHSVNLHRDGYGLGHVLADSTEAALYGIGRATAQDRLFQMDLNRKWAEGRLSELYWQTDGTDQGRALNATLLKHDQSMRVWGFSQRNEALIAKLPEQDRRRLQAFADGVNSVLNDSDFVLPDAYLDLGLTQIERWSPADSLHVWDRMSHLFAQNNLQDEIDNLLDCEDSDGCTVVCEPPIDDSGAIIPEGEGPTALNVGPSPLKGGSLQRPEPFKASHGWVVGGDRTTTGAPILAIDPKIVVSAPSTLYPVHWVSPRHNVWGLSFAGSMAPVLFWNDHLGQSVTSYGGDIADLFELDVLNDDQYRVDGDVLNFNSRLETIRTVDPAVSFETKVRESIFGPVANDLLEAVPKGRVFAVRHLERDRAENTHSALAALDASMASTHAQYQAAMDNWLIPGIHALYGGVDVDTGDSHIAYYMAGGVPWRAAKMVEGLEYTGRYPYDGSTRFEDWAGHLSITEKPHVVDPAQGYLFAANNLPIGSEYDTVSYLGYPMVGDTYRSYTLRGVLDKALSDPAATMNGREVHAVHYNASPKYLSVLADILQHLSDRGDLGTPIRLDATASTPTQRAQKVLAALKEWKENDGLMSQSSAYMVLLANLTGGPSGLTTRSRSGYHPEHACAWNEAEGGVTHFFKGFVEQGDEVLDDAAVDFILDVANRAWTKTLLDDSDLSQNPLDWARRDVGEYAIPYQRHLGLGTPFSELHSDPQATAVLDQRHGALINSTSSSTAPGTIDFSNHKKDVVFFPPGVSEDPGNRSFDTMVGILELVSEGDQGAMPHLAHEPNEVKADSVSLEVLTYSQ